MGGSPSNTPLKIKRKPLGTGGEGEDKCPHKFKASVSGPAAGIKPGTWLDVVLERAQAPSRVVFKDSTSGATVGSLIGIPKLNTLVDCLNSGVSYRAHVESVSQGRVDVTVIRH